MIECRQAKSLFDAHLDDELSSSMTTELHAHLVSCGDCRHELSLIEACGDVIAKDPIAPVPGDEFTDRVLSMWRPIREQTAQANRWRTFSIWAGTGISAAAAAIMLLVLPLSPAASDRTVVHGTRVSVTDVNQTTTAFVPLAERKTVHTIRAMNADPGDWSDRSAAPEPSLSVGGLGANPCGPFGDPSESLIMTTVEESSPAAALFHLSGILEGRP